MIATTEAIKESYRYEPVTGSETMESIREKARKLTEAGRRACAEGPVAVKVSRLFDNETIFKMVQNPVYWKEPIIPAFVQTKVEAEILASACAFYGHSATIRLFKAGYLVTTGGYVC